MATFDSFLTNIEWVSLLILLSGASLLFSLLLLPYAATHFPSEYFLLESPSYQLKDFLLRTSFTGKLRFFLRNLLAIVLFIAGCIMLFTPGQGLLTILLALVLLSFPRKRELLLNLVQRPRMSKALDLLRKRAGKPAVILPDNTAGLHHLRSGSPDNPALLCLHGFLGTGQDWLELVKQLNHDFFVLCPDLPGCGKSLNFQEDQNFDYEFVVDRLLKLLDRYQVKSVHLLGYSLGARLALYMALRHPTRVRSLLLESVSPGIENYKEREERLKIDQKRAGELRTAGMEAFLKSWYGADLFASLATRPELLAQIIQERLRTNSATWAARVIEDLSPGNTPNLWPELHALNVPVLCMHGALDRKYSQIASRLGRELPDIRVVCMEQSGHNLHLENASEYYHRVEEFLRNLEEKKIPLEASLREC